jgi:hypothetical protein
VNGVISKKIRIFTRIIAHRLFKHMMKKSDPQQYIDIAMKRIPTVCFPCTNVILLVYLSMSVQSFVGPWPLFYFLNPIHSREDSLDGGSARRKATTYKQNNTNRE